MTTVTIQLHPETEKWLRQRVSRLGMSLEAYVQELAERAAMEEANQGPAPTPPTHPVLSPEEWVAEWRALVESQPIRPVILDDSRASFYEGREE
jgi:hypothetical protein